MKVMNYDEVEAHEVLLHDTYVKFVDYGFLLKSDESVFSNVFLDILSLTDDSLKWCYDAECYKDGKSGLYVEENIYESLKGSFYRWERHHNPRYGKSLEVSSKGDKRYSAFYAWLPNGDNIETAYQLDVKGYRICGDDWRLGKGNPPIESKTPLELFEEYTGLWEEHFRYKPRALEELKSLLLENNITHLTDMFASSPINQARAIAYILNKDVYNKLKAEADKI